MQPNKIKEIRKKRGMTQEQLAEKLGVKRSVVSKYENGSISPTAKMLEKIAKALDVSTFELDNYSVIEISEYIKDALSSLTTPNPELLKNMTDLFNGVSYAMNHSLSDSVGKSESNKVRMLSAFDTMNEDGQKKAADNVEDLAKVPKYQKEKDNAKP